MAMIPIIDLFAGPGGLGEGFSAFNAGKNNHPFKIRLSIEKDPHAHKTLTLRSFYRQFIHSGRMVPKEYYRYIAGEITKGELKSSWLDEFTLAEQEAQLIELGKYSDDKIDKLISKSIIKHGDWVLIGGPPCQAYSLVGRSRMQKASDYKQAESFEKDHRHHLYKEYLRIIYKFAPAVFVMENVEGILSSKLNGEYIFPKIRDDLSQPGRAAREYGWEKGSKSKYRMASFVLGEEPEDFRDYLIRCEDYGIPQARHRVILLGIREDVWKKINGNVEPIKKQAHISVSRIIGSMAKLRSGFSKGEDSLARWREYFRDIKGKEWVKCLDSKVRKTVIAAFDKTEDSKLGRNHKTKGAYLPKVHKKWYKDSKLIYLPNHETRSHMDSDLARYLFVAAYGRAHRVSPKIRDFPYELLPNHKNIDKKATNQKFSDRFKVQLSGKPASTVTSHISKDGHYFIHPDPAQCRSLTVREAARLQTFPDNYFFEGNRTQQYHQVGNAVPPLLARQLAAVVYKIISSGSGSLDV